MGVEVLTFGCRLNSLESEVMRREAEAAGLDNAILVNTCAVTAEATRQARQSIRRARRENPEARIIVSGCAAQIDPDMFANMDEVDRVLGNEEKFDQARYAASPDHGLDFGISQSERVQVNDIMSVTETAGHLIDGMEGRARAFVQIQNGCDHRCTFCIIPYGRGNSRSVPMGSVLDQIRTLVANGYREVVLTGVDITSYGTDLPGTPKLGALVRKILEKVPDLDRLRLSSIDSIEVDPDLMRAIADEPRLMPHFHLSLQAGDDMILKRMKRRHLRADAIAFSQAVRAMRPDAVFGADLIAGFPTETEAMFENTLSIVEACALTYLHVFPYSPRPGTPAAKMPQVDRATIKARAARLRVAGASALDTHLGSLIGTRQAVLMEKPDYGRTPCFTGVQLSQGSDISTATNGPQIGDIIEVTIAGKDTSGLLATRIAAAA